MAERGRHAGRLRIPGRVGSSKEGGTKVTAETIRSFFDRVADPFTSKRAELVLGWLQDNAFVSGLHWLKIRRPEILGQTGSRRLPRVVSDDRDTIPQPVNALTLKHHDAEVAQLSKRHSEVTVDPSDAANPGSRAAAKTSTNIMKYHLFGDRGIKWQYIHRDYWDQVVRYGTSPLKSWLLWDHFDTDHVACTTAMKCKGSMGMETKFRPAERPMMDAMSGMPMTDEYGVPMMESYTEGYEEEVQYPPCGCILSEPGVPAAKVEGMGGGLGMMSGDGMDMGRGGLSAFRVEANEDDINPMTGTPRAKYTAVACPCCGGDLETYMPSKDEARSGKDYYGRPLGKEVPLAKAMVEVPSVYGTFPENEGIGVKVYGLEQCAFLSPRPLSWVERYFPKNAHLVEPDPAEEIAETFPILGEYDTNSRGARGVSDRNIYADHVIVKEFYSKTRTKEHPRGRAIIMAGRVVLLDDDFWISSEDPGKEDLARVEFPFSRCFPRDGELWADGFASVTRSPNKALNMTLSQMIDKREHSFFNVIAADTMEVVREWWKKLAGYVIRYKRDMTAPADRPEVVNTPLTDTSALNEAKFYEDSTNANLGLMEADVGELRGLATTPYSSYSLSKQSSGERREPRIKEGIEAIQTVLRHQLLLIQRYYREPRQYRVQAADGWEVKEFQGADIAGETDVRVKEEAFFDQKAATRDATAKAVELKQLPLPTKRAQREYLKAIGVDDKLLEESNVQLDKFQRDFMAWKRTSRTPIVDETMDDPTVGHSEIGRLLLGDDGLEAYEGAKWDEVLDAVVGWQDELPKLQEIVAGIKPLGWKSGQPLQPYLPQYYAQLQQQAEKQAQMLYQQQAQMSLAQGIQPTPYQPAPPVQMEEYVNQEPVKAGLQWQIVWVFSEMLQRAGLSLDEPEGRRAYAEMRAVWETYRIMSTAQQGAAPMAPGTDRAAMQQPAVM